MSSEAASTPERIRSGLRRRWRGLERRQRQLTSAARMLPSVLVIGAQKAGTTSLYRYLTAHPKVAAPYRKEPSYFGIRYSAGLAWYRGQFPLAIRRLLRPGLITLEASTDTIDHPHALGRVAATLPEAKLIALLRDPVERAFSHYHHTRRTGHEPLSFEEALAREDERVGPILARMIREPDFYDHAWDDYCYRSRGHYADQLLPWLERFGPQLRVVRSEDLFEDGERVVGELFDFLELERPEGPIDAVGRVFNPGPSETMLPRTRARLVEHYAPHNERLYALLGRDLGWQRP